MNISSEDCYVELTNAIVKQAADDYVIAKKCIYYLNRLSRVGAISGYRPLIDRVKEERDSIIDFFHSEWYRSLCKVDGEWLLNKLDEGFEEWKANEIKVD